MESMAEIYTSAVHHHMQRLWANWLPTSPVELGDIGILEDSVFVPLANISRFGIEIGKPQQGTIDAHQAFNSSNDVTVKLEAKGQAGIGSVTAANATLSITFGSQHAAFFNAAGCSYFMIADKLGLAAAVMKLYDAGQWNREWVVVTDVVPSKETTVVISGAANASIVLEADASVPNINVAQLGLNLSVASSSNVGYEIVGSSGLTPLFGLSKVKSRFLWKGSDFKPITRGGIGSKKALQILQDSPLFETEPREYLDFVQLE
jgi:hypothetical protein